MKSILFAAAMGVCCVIGSAQGDSSLPEGHAAAGATVFAQCSACHTVGAAAQNNIGPVLNGVMGRRAASFAGYRYSSALRNSGLVWDEASLATFLHGPEKAVPGTKMSFPGLSSDQDIADVIAYLRQYGADGATASK